MTSTYAALVSKLRISEIWITEQWGILFAEMLFVIG
jgi:hypothetical protein